MSNPGPNSDSANLKLLLCIVGITSVSDNMLKIMMVQCVVYYNIAQNKINDNFSFFHDLNHIIIVLKYC